MSIRSSMADIPADRYDLAFSKQVIKAREKVSAPSSDIIKTLTDRFLCWRLPKDFNPDCGISFDSHNGQCEPIGTNLLTATQAESMFTELLQGIILPDPRLDKNKPIEVMLEEWDNSIVYTKAQHDTRLKVMECLKYLQSVTPQK